MVDPHSFARRIVPDDHECLFSAIALLAEGGGVDDVASIGRAEVSPEVSLESKGPPGFSCILEMLN